MERISSSEITPERAYLSRRQFLKAAGALVAGSAVAAACGPLAATALPPTAQSSPTPTSTGQVDDVGDPVTPYDTVTGFNNYYEFSTDKRAVAKLAQTFRAGPWALEVTGLVRNPKTYALDELEKRFPSEERIYRLRCVEAWSMVIPWLGFPLGALLREAEPMTSAKYLRLTSILDPAQMPGQHDTSFNWPYVEGLRLDEAEHPLTLLGTGLYGKPLPSQNGAPLRLVVPWKYGFKSIKAIVRIELLQDQPTTFWMAAVPDAYGFYSNVNPEVSRTGWSQAKEQRIGAPSERPTLKFNGYSEEVASLYSGMDLRTDY